MKGYKAFDENLACCGGFEYEIGKEYEVEGKLEMCFNGFHFCKTIADCYRYYPRDEKTRICEVEALGEIIEKDDKCCTSKIKIIRELSREEHHCGNTEENSIGYGNIGVYNTGNFNKGNDNKGDYNKGDRNTGSANTGDYNDGVCNRGDGNTGSNNIGDYNYGHDNNGDCNKGDSNKGERNKGIFNVGNHNNGDCNKGNYNNGDYNVGNHNYGIRNKGNYQVGICNTNAPLVIFNKVSKMTLKDLIDSGAYDDIAADKLTDRVRAIDTFDEKVWNEIHGKKED